MLTLFWWLNPGCSSIYCANLETSPMSKDHSPAAFYFMFSSRIPFFLSISRSEKKTRTFHQRFEWISCQGFLKSALGPHKIGPRAASLKYFNQQLGWFAGYRSAFRLHLSLRIYLSGAALTQDFPFHSSTLVRNGTPGLRYILTVLSITLNWREERRYLGLEI